MMETLAKLTMGGLLVLATPIGQSTTELWAQWGLAGVVVGYVLWRDWQRERRMSAAIEHQQRWIRETLLSALERNAVAMERMVACLDTAAAGNETPAGMSGDQRHAITRRIPIHHDQGRPHDDLG